MCMADDIDSCDVYNAKIYRARKQYKCSECRRAIEIAENYKRIFLVYDGDAVTTFACEHCIVAQDWLLRECHGFLTQGVLQDIEEHFEAAGMGEKLPGFWLGRIVLGMRKRWKTNSGKMLPIPILPPPNEVLENERIET